MSKKIVLLTLVLALLLSAMVVTSSAQPRTAGVSVGDRFEFGDVTVTWSSNDPNASKVWYGMDLEWYNQTEWMSGEVTQVSGTNVTMQSVLHFKNGTEEISGGWIDVDTGEGVNATLMLISADLNENDAIYASGNYSTWLINETTTRTYPGGVRETNHINFTYAYNYTIPPDTSIDYFYSMNFYWDRATGMMVEDSFEMRNQTGEYLTAWSMDFKITESNVWVVPEFPRLTSIVLILVVLTTAIVIYKRRLLKQSILYS